MLFIRELYKSPALGPPTTLIIVIIIIVIIWYGTRDMETPHTVGPDECNIIAGARRANIVIPDKPYIPVPRYMRGRTTINDRPAVVLVRGWCGARAVGGGVGRPNRIEIRATGGYLHRSGVPQVQ